MGKDATTTIQFLRDFQVRGLYDFPGAIAFQGGYHPRDVVAFPAAVAADLVARGIARIPPKPGDPDHVATAEPALLAVRFHRERIVTRAESHRHAGHYLPGDTAAFAAPLAAGLVLEGAAACDALARIRFVVRAEIAAPSPYAGIYDASPQLFVVDAATAAALVAKGQAVAA